MNTSFAVRNPYVLDTPMGSQMRHRRKSTKYNPTENLNTNEYILGGRWFMAMASTKIPSEMAQMRARHLTLS